jgi:dimethylhistidine N-methyltransferase
MPGFSMPAFIQHVTLDPVALAAEAASGLTARPAAVAPKFFYDELGSRLFSAITALPEYYVTRTEARVFAAHAPQMAQALRRRGAMPPTMIDLGAGTCEKASRLFATFEPRRYVAVDISTDFLHGVLECLQREHREIEMIGVGTDFSSRLDLPANLLDGPALVFYPGSSIGNFEPDQARRFLRDARAAARGGALLIGVDLVKPTAVLEPAYDDALGVTAAFNRNVLTHLNRLLGGDFDLAAWRHVAFFDREASRIEMHLEATRATVVTWRGGGRGFEAGERILTEYSYKWERDAFARLLRDAGFDDVQVWTDEDQWFAVMLAT